jgi:tRNA U34 2-thiouridine synthase MnmA/TrmU
LCNRYVKFHYFRKYIEEKLNITMMATGHYAQLDNNNDNNDIINNNNNNNNDISNNNNNTIRLRSGSDLSKDQSYFLCKTPVSSICITIFLI